MTKTHTKWSESRIQELKRLVDNGFDAKDIGLALGATAIAIYNRVKILGIKLPKSRDIPPPEMEGMDLSRHVWQTKIQPRLKSHGDCLVWPGASGMNGHGHVRVRGKLYMTHRIAAEVSIGRILSDVEFACHHCDNPPCCNPAHMFVGTQTDNVRDMMAKGRGGGQFAKGDPRLVGEGSLSRKLTTDDVLAIRAMHAGGARVVDLARRFGVTESNVCSIIHRKTWTHLPDAP